MARHGFNGEFHLDNKAGALQDISEHCTDVTFSFTRDTADGSGFGDDAHEHLGGMTDATLSVSGNFDPAVSGTIFGGGSEPATRSFRFAPNSTSGQPQYSGECIITSFDPAASIGDVIKFSLSLQCTGAITVSTVP